MLFPPSAAVTVVVDGAVVRSYQPASLRCGRTYAPLDPFVTRLADRIWYDGRTLTIERGARVVRLWFGRKPRVVLLGAVVRGLGGSITYGDHRVDVQFPREPIATPSPFDSAFANTSPRVVFTPEPSPTVRPVWSGPPLPRRTPIPVPAPTP
jgi:hypothetical protein